MTYTVDKLTEAIHFLIRKTHATAWRESVVIRYLMPYFHVARRGARDIIRQCQSAGLAKVVNRDGQRVVVAAD